MVAVFQFSNSWLPLHRATI